MSKNTYTPGMQNFEPLPEITSRFDLALPGMTILVHGDIKLARDKGGKLYALSWRSDDPARLRNARQREAWARLVGVKPSEVEAYVRRKRRQEAQEQLERDVQRALKLLQRKEAKAVMKKLGVDAK